MRFHWIEKEHEKLRQSAAELEKSPRKLWTYRTLTITLFFVISLYEWGVFYTPEKERKNGDTNDGCYCDYVYWSAGRQIFIAMQFKQVESDLAGSVHTVSDFFHGSSAGKPGKTFWKNFLHWEFRV